MEWARTTYSLAVAGFLFTTGCLRFDGPTGLEGYCFDEQAERYVTCDASVGDALPPDAEVDAATTDALPSDTGVAERDGGRDAGFVDIGFPDTGAQRDAEPVDFGSPADAEPLDAGFIDAGFPDAGVYPDAEPLDIGFPDSGVVRDSGPLVNNGQAADLVLGQPDFSSTAANTGDFLARMSAPQGCASDGQDFFVSDSGNSRVLRWASVPLFSGTSAVAYIGGAGGPTQSALAFPDGVAVHNSQLWLADSDSRLVAWLSYPASSAPADILVGQSTWTSDQPGEGPAQFTSPSAMAFDRGRLLLTDPINNRILVWSTVPAGVGLQPASFALGQPDLQSNGQISPPRADTLLVPLGVATDPQGRLFVADSLNNRVLVWSQPPTTNTAPADIVLGQSGFASNQPNTGAPSVNAVGLSFPQAVLYAFGHLFVADAQNHRILIWKDAAIATGAPADYVLGVSSLSAQASSTPSASTLRAPAALCVQGSALWVVQPMWNRVSRFQLNPP